VAVRVVYLGNAAWSVPPLVALADHPDLEVVLVLTRTPRPGRRGAGPEPTPVATAARERGLPVTEVVSVRDGEGLERLLEARPDVLAVVAYGELLPREVLEAAPLGAVNLHLSLLPRWRGASPVQHALLAGDAETGVTAMLIDEGLDTGPILEQVSTAVGEDEDAGALGARLAELGGPVLARAVAALADDSAAPVPQDAAAATSAPKLTADDRRIRWDEPAGSVLGRIRAFAPSPGADTLRDGRRLKILAATEAQVASAEPGIVIAVGADGFDVAAGDGSVSVLEVASEGRARMDAASWVRGAHLEPGERLG
jgi:methionyl-tRNA formyltransferase